ncbi:MAG: DUF1826 domain-containing protein [Pseudomonadota bacterium]
MSGLGDTIAERAAIGLVDAPEDLSVFLRPSCAAAVWARRPLTSFQTWIDAVAPGHLPRARVTLRPSAVHDAMFRICEASVTPDCAERARFVDDVAALADIFARLMRSAFLTMRLEVLTTDSGEYFDLDAVSARLVCTYRGPGPQIRVPTVKADPHRSFTVPTGAALLLRGGLWPAQPAAGLRCHAPRIRGTGQTRLVLVLDPIPGPGPSPGQEDHRPYVH